MVTRKGKSQFTFSYSPGVACRKIEIAGNFNSWQPSQGRMTRQKDGSYRKRLMLESGEYRYRFIVDGQWTDDPDAEQKVPNAFGSHDAVVCVE